MVHFPLYTKIVGVSHSNPDGSSRQAAIRALCPEEDLKLFDDASPRFPEAIKVCDSTGRQLGYLSASLAADLRAQCPDFEKLYCQVKSVGPDEVSHLYGARIIISDRKISPMSITISLSSDRSPDYGARSSYTQRPSPSHLPDPIYKSPQQYNQKHVPWGCIIPLIIGAILGLLLMKPISQVIDFFSK